MRRLPHTVVKHALPLVLDGICRDAPSFPERNAATTRLRPVTSAVNGIIIMPGETFSMSRVLGGHPADGLSTHRVATLLHWMTLHSPLTVVERSAHPFDLSPDEGLPWGVSSSMVHRRATLAIRNDSPFIFQFMTRVNENHILGELRSEKPLPYSYTIYSDHEEFIELDNQIFRHNEIWRRVIEKRTGDVVTTELVEKNIARITYDAVTE